MFAAGRKARATLCKSKQYFYNAQNLVSFCDLVPCHKTVQTFQNVFFQLEISSPNLPLSLAGRDLCVCGRLVYSTVWRGVIRMANWEGCGRKRSRPRLTNIPTFLWRDRGDETPHVSWCPARDP